MAFKRASAITVAGIIGLGLWFHTPVASADAPPPVVSALVNAATFQAGPIAPGEVVSLFGVGLGPASPISFQPDSAGRVALMLGSTRVLFNGAFSPVLYASNTQVTAVVPAFIDPGATVAVQVEYLGIASTPVIAKVAAAAPGMFTATQNGRGQVAALNQDGSINSSAAPASPGSIVALFVCGGGRTQPAFLDGVITGSAAPAAASAVTATVGGAPAEVTYSGAAPGLISGIFQVNIRIPAGTPSGNGVFIALNIAGVDSRFGATVAVANGDAALPGAPEALEAAAGPGGIALHWTSPADATVRRTRIERAPADGGTFTEMAALSADASDWTDPHVQPSSAYSYRIRFETPAGFSDYSAAARAATDPAYITPPEQLTAAAVSPSKVNLMWKTSAPDVDSIIVERSSGGDFSPVATLGAGAGIFQDSDVSSSTTYSYRLSVVTAAGASGRSGPVTVTTPAPATLPDAAPRIHPADPHRLSIGGATWYVPGYYPTLAALTADQPDPNYYLPLIDTLAAGGATYFRLVFSMGQPYGDAMPVYVRTGPGNARDGRPRFDLTQFNQTYFDYWRTVVQYAQAKGMVIQLCMMDGWHATKMVVEDNGPQKAWGLQYDYYYSGNNINGVNVTSSDTLMSSNGPAFAYQQALTRKIVDTLGDLPNIVWEIGNETGRFGWELPLADYVTAYEKSKRGYEHLVMPRDLPGHQYVPGQCDNTPAMTHAGLVRAFPQNLVLITDNDCVGPDTADVRRGKAWAALTAGAQIDFFHGAITDIHILQSDDTIRGIQYVGLQAKFLSGLNIDLAGMVPLDKDVTNGWALGRSGVEYIIYLPEGGDTSVPGLPGPGRAVWFNPRDGSTQDAGGGPTFTSPDASDWVLYLVR